MEQEKQVGWKGFWFTNTEASLIGWLHLERRLLPFFYFLLKILSSTQRMTPRPRSDDPRNSSNLQQRKIARQGAPADKGHTW